jgi:hypothetical protein
MPKPPTVKWNGDNDVGSEDEFAPAPLQPPGEAGYEVEAIRVLERQH